MELKPIQLELDGANRGGMAYTHALLDLRVGPTQVHVFDQSPQRAETLARVWREQGRQAIGEPADARTRRAAPVDVRAVCVDDATALLQIVQGPHQSRLLQWGLLVNTVDAGLYGGRVLGFGGSLPPESPRQEETALLLRSLADMVGPRVTSQAMRGPLLNGPQMEKVRALLYRELAADVEELRRGRPPTRLLVVEAFSRTAPATGFNLCMCSRQGQSRRALQERSRDLAAARSERHPCAVAFVEAHREAWLYLVLLTPRAQRWEIQATTELPGSAAHEVLRSEMQTRPRREREGEIHGREVVATD